MAQSRPLNTCKTKNMEEVDISNPFTWSLDDPLLWLHEESYRKYFGLAPDHPIPNHPAERGIPKQLKRQQTRKAGGLNRHTSSSFMKSRTKEDQKYKKEEALSFSNAALSSAPAAEQNLSTKPTKEELKARLADKSRSSTANEYLLMNDLDFDVEEDWMKGIEHHFTDVDDSAANEEFGLWLAQKDIENEEKLKKNLSKMKLLVQSSVLGSDFSESNSGRITVNRNIRKKPASGIPDRRQTVPRAGLPTSTPARK